MTFSATQEKWCCARRPISDIAIETRDICIVKKLVILEAKVGCWMRKSDDLEWFLINYTSQGDGKLLMLIWPLKTVLLVINHFMWLRNLNSKQHDPNVSSHSATWCYPISSIYCSLESPNKAQILSLNKHTPKAIQYLKRRVFCRESEAGREIKIFFCRRRAFKKKNLFFLLISLTLQFYGSSHVSDNRKTERHGDRNAKFMKLKNLKFPPSTRWWFLEEWTKVKFPSDTRISRRRFRPAIRAPTSDTG